ncbi:hypothetical protein Tco_1010528, partial [Tanacetum coccineum]
VGSSGWPFVFAVPGQMTHLVASLTLDSTRSYVMQCAFLTRGKASSIPTVFSWGGNISPNSFLPSILLLLVIIVAVAIVVTVVLVVVVGEGILEVFLYPIARFFYHQNFICDHWFLAQNYALLPEPLTSGLWAEVKEDDMERARFRDGRISSGRKKYWGSNIGDSGNIRDGGKKVGGAIGAYGGVIGEMASEAKRSLVKSSEESEGVFPSEAGE